MKPISEQGYIIPAFQNNSVDYVQCARKLAESIKHWHPSAEICLLTNADVVADTVFDHVRQYPHPTSTNGFANDWQAFHASPFRETIKLEADMLITSPIDHWWAMFRHRDVVISTGCRDWRNNISTNRHYRQIFDSNNLPDVYNAVTYWRLSQTAVEFFNTVRSIFVNWEDFKKLLKFPEEVPSTDVVYAMAANIIGPERCTMPFATYPKITHMKRHIIGTSQDPWHKELVWEHNTHELRINTIAQHGAFHYHDKQWINDI